MFYQKVMTSKTIKTILFASLIAALVLPFSGMSFEDAAAVEKVKSKQIEKPTETKFEKDTKVKVLNLFKEKLSLEASGKELKDKYDKDGEKSLTATEKSKMDKIQKRLAEIKVEFGTINAESHKLYSPTPEVKNKILNNQQIVRDSNIPYNGLGTDMKTGALAINFETQELADQSIPLLDEMLSVPYYIEISPADVDLGCTNLNSNCDPLMGGIEIGTQKPSSPGGWTTCSISVPMYRNVFWWTEEGFVTAAHCFDNINGNDAKQPSLGAKVGDVTRTQNSGECDCAFVKKSSSESTLFGNWWGTNTSNQLLSKGDMHLTDIMS